MTLIICPDCQKQISGHAAACPHCGRPAQPGAAHKTVQTIQATGKTWKIIQLIGGVLICAGVISCVYSIQNPDPRAASFATALMFLGGFSLLVAGKLGAWWRHK